MARAPAAISLTLAFMLPTLAGAATINAPKSGSEYRGSPPANAIVQISGRSVEIAALSFPCGEVSGRTSVNDFRLKRTSKGYRFNVDVRALVTYSDEQGDENAAVHLSGRFTLKAHKVRGHVRVRSKRCGDTGDVDWRATRR